MKLLKDLKCFACGAETCGMPATGPKRQELTNPPPPHWREGDRIRCCSREACIAMMDDVWDGKAENFYSPVDEWIFNHNYAPIAWIVVAVEETKTQVDSISLFHLLPGTHIESGKVLHAFQANSTIGAMIKFHALMEWEPYQPHPDWDSKTNSWKS